MKKKAKPNSDLNKHIKELPHMQKLLHKRRNVHRYVRILFGIVFVALFVCVIVFLCNKRTQIYSITVSGNEIINTDDVVAEVQQTLSGKYLHMIPKTSVFFYPKNKVYENLKKDFPRFDSVHVSLVNKNTLAIQVAEERGTALWCGQDSVMLNLDSQCYFTDTNGKIIDIAPYYSGDVYLRFFGGTIPTDAANPIGQTFTTTDSYQQLLKFSQDISSLGFQIKALQISPDGNDFFILDLGGTNTALVQFNAGDDYDTLFSNLQTALNNTDLASEVNTNKQNLQYFDLRFTNKVYYKFNDGTDATSTSTTASSSMQKAQ